MNYSHAYPYGLNGMVWDKTATKIYDLKSMFESKKIFCLNIE